MKIYKFKSLQAESTHCHLLQIIDENKVWCAAPETLNDTKEFHFEMDYRPTNKTGILLSNMLEKYSSLNLPPNVKASYVLLNNKLEEFTKPVVVDMVRKCRSAIGVTSFSKTGTGDWLWEEYGGKGNGAVVEFDMPDNSLGKTFHTVDYVTKRLFHIDVFLESQAGDPTQIYRNILCTKTKKWQDEQEIRFLGQTPNINITFDAPATGIIIGKHVSNPLAKKLIQHCDRRKIKVTRQK